MTVITQCDTPIANAARDEIYRVLAEAERLHHFTGGRICIEIDNRVVKVEHMNLMTILGKLFIRPHGHTRIVR